MARKTAARTTETSPRAGSKPASGTLPLPRRKAETTSATTTREVAARRKPSAAARPARETPRRNTPADLREVEAFNRRYYDAFQSLDLAQMSRVWWHDDEASCIHPGWDLRRGWAHIRQAYEEIFENTRSIRFSLGDVRVRASGDLAFVTCVENLVSEEADTLDYLGAVLATNIFERRAGSWRLIHHHASPFGADVTEIPEGPLH